MPGLFLHFPERQFMMHASRLLPAAIRRRAFTLVEIMIVVLIIGILLAIAIPNFISARETSRAKSCVGNLKQIDSAKQQAIMDNTLNEASTPVFFIDGTTATTSGPTGNYQLVSTANTFGYIRRQPVCPSGGQYTLGNVAVATSCNITGPVGSGYAPNEKWYHGY